MSNLEKKMGVEQYERKLARSSSIKSFMLNTAVAFTLYGAIATGVGYSFTYHNLKEGYSPSSIDLTFEPMNDSFLETKVKHFMSFPQRVGKNLAYKQLLDTSSEVSLEDNLENKQQ